MFYRDLNIVDSSEVDLSHWEQSESPKKAIVSSSNPDFPNRFTHNYSSRILHDSASVITIPRKFYGEKIKPKSVKNKPSLFFSEGFLIKNTIESLILIH